MNIARIVNIDRAAPSGVERRFAAVLLDLLWGVTWLKGWTVKPASLTKAYARWDLTAGGPLPGGRRAILCIECKSHFTPSQFPNLADRPCGGSDQENKSRVLAMPYVSPRMAALCREHGWSWFDLAGNCRIEIPGAVLIERSGREPVRIEQPAGANLSSPEAGRVVRALLAPENAGKRWTQREMAGHFNTLAPRMAAPSLALVNKVIQHLREQAFVEPLANRGFRVRDHEGLLQVWREAYRFERSLRKRYFTLLQGQALTDRLMALEPPVAYGVFSAADIQALHVRQPRIWLYLTPDTEEQFKATVEAKLVDSGENLVVLITEDTGVFYHLDAGKHRLPCTNAIQTYIDLSLAGGRGEEAAEAVLVQRLRPAWKGETHEP